MEPLLSATGLTVTLPAGQALRGVDLDIARGESLGLIGESGCGKSMTALALMGLLPEGAAMSGRVAFEGKSLDPTDERAMCRVRGDRIGMIFQEPMTALNPLHTIGEQVMEPLRQHRSMSRREARDEALRLLERVRLPDAKRRIDAYPHQLSGGQRQRVMIAAALACGPSLLIADEPTTALDATIQREILDLIAGLVADTGMALLLISHDLGVVSRRVQRVMVMYAGLVVDTGPTAEVFARLAHPYTRGLFGARPRLDSPRGARLATIAGRVPALGEVPAGCPFADRCGFAVDACRAALPPLVDAGPGHRVRCIRPEAMNP